MASFLLDLLVLAGSHPNTSYEIDVARTTWFSYGVAGAGRPGGDSPRPVDRGIFREDYPRESYGRTPKRKVDWATGELSGTDAKKVKNILYSRRAASH